MISIFKPHLTCSIALTCMVALVAAQFSLRQPNINTNNNNNNNNNNNPQQRLLARSHYSSFYNNDPSYNNRFYKNRDYYQRQYYGNLFKNYNPEVTAPQARILAQDTKLNQDGTYSYSYETENGIQVEEHGTPVKAGTEEQKEVVEGSYSYVAPNGLHVIVNYTADENGYHPTITYVNANAEQFTRLQKPARTTITRPNIGN
ncbi:uncharacterized protein Cpr49Ad [Eurosta solidaginis]|uniref:uncharacterized protein Cpr49Ad n=1 Tax=Eurosta solidaginis TaxID=178769 RepID=UPI003530D720